MAPVEVGDDCGALEGIGRDLSSGERLQRLASRQQADGRPEELDRCFPSQSSRFFRLYGGDSHLRPACQDGKHDPTIRQGGHFPPSAGIGDRSGDDRHLLSLATDQLSAPTSSGSAVSPEHSGPGLKQVPQQSVALQFHPPIHHRP
jgi:hypothetical protein